MKRWEKVTIKTMGYNVFSGFYKAEAMSTEINAIFKSLKSEVSKNLSSCYIKLYSDPNDRGIIFASDLGLYEKPSSINSVTLSVKDEKEELFDLNGRKLRSVIEII